MQTFYMVMVAKNGFVAIDVWSGKRAGHVKARSYYQPTAASLDRVRRLWRRAAGPVFVLRGWSAARQDAYRAASRRMGHGRPQALSLDYLETSGRRGEENGLL